MNCKKGDLALIVHGASSGNVVTCLERYDGPWLNLQGGFYYAPGWVVDRPLLQLSGRLANVFRDEVLRPIRDQDGEDETLTWAGKPEKVTA